MEFENILELFQINQYIYSLFLIILVIIQYFYIKKNKHKKDVQIYEQSYIKQKPKDYELNKKELTEYYVKKLQEDPKFVEWQSQKKNI